MQQRGNAAIQAYGASTSAKVRRTRRCEEDLKIQVAARQKRLPASLSGVATVETNTVFRIYYRLPTSSAEMPAARWWQPMAMKYAAIKERQML